MRKKIWTGMGIVAVILIVAASAFSVGKAGIALFKERLSQYVDQQVGIRLEEFTSEQAQSTEAKTEQQTEQQTETQTEPQTTAEAITQQQTEAATVNAQVEQPENPLEGMAELILPDVIYLRKTENDQQYNFYYKNVTSGEYDIFEVMGHEGIQFKDCYRIETGKLQEHIFEVSMRLFTNNNEVIAGKGVVFYCVEQQSDQEINLMCIGDSWTEMGTYCARIREQMDHLNLLGVMERPGENLPRVGHGGWSLDKFMNSFMTDLDSPFLFPVGVNGNQYKGSVQTMRNIVTCDDGTYNVALYKKFARGWQDEGEYLWDENGYYKNPQVGDVMADGDRPDGEKYIQWDGGQWVPMEQQPEGYAFDFSKYMERFSVCFGGKPLTHVSILTGANDFTYGCTEEEVRQWIEGYLQPMIQSIHAYDPNITVMIAAGQLGSDQDAFGSSFGAMISSRQYNSSMKTMLKTLIQYYDDDAHKEENIYFVPIYAMLDTENGYSTEVEQMDSYTDEMVERHDNALHPNPKGMNQVGDAFLGILELTRQKNEGE